MANPLLAHRVVLFKGDEPSLSLDGADRLVADAGLIRDDFDLETRDGDDGDPREWLGGAGTSPFLAERRVVVVRHALRLDPDRFPATLLKALPRSSLVVLVADEEATNDPGRLERLKKVGTRLGEIVKEAGGAVVEAKIDKSRIRGLLREELAADELRISDRALDALLEMCGDKYGRAREELQKLRLFAVGGMIREGDVEAVVVPSREYNVFKLVDAILEGRGGDALAQLRNMVADARKAEDEAFRSILPNLNRTLRLLWQARILIEAGCGTDDVPASVAVLLPDKPDLRREQGYRQGRLMKAARSVTLGRLARCLAIVADADARLKGALPAYRSMETLERMTLEMSDAIHPRR